MIQSSIWQPCSPILHKPKMFDMEEQLVEQNYFSLDLCAASHKDKWIPSQEKDDL